MEESDFNMIEKYLFAVYDPYNHLDTNDVNRMRFLLFAKSIDNKLRKLHPTREVLELRILCSVYTAGWIWGVTLYYSQVIKYHLRLTVDIPRTRGLL